MHILLEHLALALVMTLYVLLLVLPVIAITAVLAWLLGEIRRAVWRRIRR